MPRRNKMSPTGEKTSDSDNASGISLPVRTDDQHSVFSYGENDVDVFNPTSAATAEANEIGGGLAVANETELKTSMEDKFIESLDLAIEKRATIRVEALKFLCRSLQGRVMPAFIISRVATLTDIVEKNLRKGKSEEQILASHLAALVNMQLGVEFFRSGYKPLRELFLTMLLNPATNINVRAAISMALGVCTFFGDEEPGDLARILSKLSQSFEAGYNKGDGTAAISPETARFYTKCLQSWALLMTVAREDVYEKEYKQHGHRIRELLHSGDVALRIAAGECLTLIQELMSEIDSDFELPGADEVVGEMRQLATDSLRYRSKNDRRFQRSTFRQIVRYMEEGDAYDEKVKFGKQTLELDSWQRKLQYDCFCSVVKSGILIHLQANDVLRSKFALEQGALARFELEEAARQQQGTTKSAKKDSQLQQATVHKERQMKRVKDREKRSKVLSEGLDD